MRTSGGGHRMGKEFTGIRMCCGARVGLGLLEVSAHPQHSHNLILPHSPCCTRR